MRATFYSVHFFRIAADSVDFEIVNRVGDIENTYIYIMLNSRSKLSVHTIRPLMNNPRLMDRMWTVVLPDVPSKQMLPRSESIYK